MSIPSAGHTIYSFITLCLKEHRDVARRKEITAGIEVGGKRIGCHRGRRHISETAL